MGGLSYRESPDGVNGVVERVLIRTETVVAHESIIVKDGQLVFDRDDYPLVKVTRGFFNRHVRVGCHRLTKEAWELLKKKVDGWKDPAPCKHGENPNPECKVCNPDVPWNSEA